MEKGRPIVDESADKRDRDEEQEHIPLEPSGRDEPPKAADGGEDVRSLIDQARASAEKCPNCGAPMAAEAIVCTACGWDLVRNELIRPEVAADEIEESTALATAGLIDWRIGLGLAAAAWVGAMGVTAAFSEADTLRQVVRVALYGPIHAGLGLLAGIVTARLLETKVGDFALLAARMALAVALAYLGRRLGGVLDLPQPAPALLGITLALAAYLATVFFSLSLAWGATVLLGGLHFVLWLLFRALRLAINWVDAAPGGADPSAMGGG